MSLSTNEIFTRDLIKNISTLLSIPEDVVSSVISAVNTCILKDLSTQFDYSTSAIIHVPRIADIEVSKTSKSVSITGIYLQSKFKNQVKDVCNTDFDPLFDSIIRNSEKLIIDKFTKLIDEGVDEDE